jgi:ubiquinone/menaquinone biosynthesis C-methylase UbiE
MFTIRLVALAFLLFFQNAVAVLAQGSPPVTSPSQQRKTSEPYTGDLSVFDSPGRADRLQINRVMDILGIAGGKAVADIGAGSGWFTVRAASRVGATGLVYAVDINPEAVRYVGDRARKEKFQNVKPILSQPDNPLLPANSVDAVLLLKTYHEVAQPVTLMQNLRAALRPGAKLGIIDRNGNGENHGVNRDIVIREAKEAGYKLLEQYDFVKGDQMDYFLVFTQAQ